MSIMIKLISYFNLVKQFTEYWIKKNFVHDIFDGKLPWAKICELVDIFFLNKLIDIKKMSKINCYFYRDDSLQ